MLGQPHWFGPSRSTHGFVHWPTGARRAGVVLCPPAGYEAVSAYPTFRILADRLSDLGLVVARISVPSTGNSFSSDESDVVSQWRRCISDAVEELRSWGIDDVAVVGLRLSASVAADASFAPAALVLWDPVVTGRRYVRAMRLLAADAPGGDAEDGSVHLAGVEFDREALAAISGVRLDVAAAVPTLVIQRTEPSLEPVIDDPADGVVVVERLTGTTGLLDTDAELAVVPHAIVGRIVSWLTAQLPDEALDRGRPTFETTGIQSDPDGRDRRHEAIRLGEHGIFTVTTTAQDVRPTGGAVIFLNNGAAPNVGPGGAWLHWAADLAGDGHRAVRVDLDGLGDSPSRRPGHREGSYPVGAADDVREVVDHLMTHGVERVAVVGLCSGALLAFDAALQTPQIDHVVSINARFDKPHHDDVHRSARAGAQTNRLLAIPLSKTPLLAMVNRIPAPIWRVLDMVRLVPLPTRAIERVVAGGTRVTLLFGPDEWGLRALRARAPKRLARLEASPLVTLEVVPELDHSMFAPLGRDLMEDRIRALFGTLGGSAPPVDTHRPSP